MYEGGGLSLAHLQTPLGFQGMQGTLTPCPVGVRQPGSFVGPVYYEDIQERGKVPSLVNCFSIWTVTSKKSEVSPVTQPPLDVSRHLYLLSK